MITTLARFAVFGTCMVVALVASPAAQAAPLSNDCSNALLTGNYGFSVNGTLNNSPTTSVGQIATNGNGTISGTETISENGVLGEDLSVLGNYSIEPNCTGTMTIQAEGRSPQNFAITVIPDGKQINMIEIDTGTTQLGTAEAQSLNSCSAAGIKGLYNLQAAGEKVGVGPLVFGGGVSSHGDGTLDGTATVSIDGVIFSSQRISGAFKIGKQCSGKAVLQVGSQGPIHLNLIVVNAGHEVLFIETDANTLLSGSLQR